MLSTRIKTLQHTSVGFWRGSSYAFWDGFISSAYLDYKILMAGVMSPSLPDSVKQHNAGI